MGLEVPSKFNTTGVIYCRTTI